MIVIDTIKESDWNAFHKIEKESFKEDLTSKEKFGELTSDEELWGAYDGEKLVGYALIRIYGNYGHLTSIAVCKQKRRQGIGLELMDFFVDYCEEKGCEKVGLYVETKNEPAIRLYQLYGFGIEKEAWEYIIRDKEIEEIASKETIEEQLYLKILTEEDAEKVKEVFPTLNVEEMKGQTKKQQNVIFGLFKGDKLKAYARYNKIKGRIRPLKCIEPEDLFKLIKMLHDEKRLTKNELKVVVENNQKLEKTMEEKNYAIFRHIWYMQTEL